MFDPLTMAWTAIAPLPLMCSTLDVVVAIPGRGIVIFNQFEFFHYEPLSNRYRKLTPGLPTTTKAFLELNWIPRIIALQYDFTTDRVHALYEGYHFVIKVDALLSNADKTTDWTNSFVQPEVAVFDKFMDSIMVPWY